MPAIINWLYKNTTAYATIFYDSAANVVTGPTTTWTGNTSPTYADVLTVQYSSTYVYVSTSGLASHIMGPWYNNAAHSSAFPNLPTNQNSISRIPLTPAVAATKSNTGGGAQGRWANGVAMFNMLDFFSWSNTSQADVGGGG